MASRPTYLSKDPRAFDPEEDTLLKVAKSVQILDTLDSIDRRDQQAAFQQAGLDLREREMQQQKDALDKQMEMRLKEFELNRTQEARIASKQTSDLDQGIRKNVALKSLGDFTKTYDPTDMDHRSQLDYMRNWAQGEGVTAQEINQGLALADNKTIALDNQFSALRNASGIQDWEKTPDGKKIDVGATISKSNYLKQELDKQAQTWTHNDRMLEAALARGQSSIADPAKRMGSAQIRAMVNENRRTLTDYQTVVGEGLFVPPDNFEERFVERSKPSDPTISKDQIGYTPVMYRRDVLELDPAYLKARSYAARIAGGEEPVFETRAVPVLKEDGKTPKIDAFGNSVVKYEPVYETMQGGGQVASVLRWVDTKRATAIAEADKKTADAVSAQAGATYDQQYGTIARNADAASKIQNAISQSPDAATRTAGQAAISALIKGGGSTPTNAGQLVPVKTGIK
jgi:hypothetical protein